MEMILLGKLVNGEEALGMGLVHRVVGRKEVMEAAVTLARSLMARDEVAVSRALRAVRQSQTATLAAGLELERAFFGELWERRFKGQPQ